MRLHGVDGSDVQGGSGIATPSEEAARSGVLEGRVPQAVLDAAPNGIVAVDEDGRIAYANPQAYKMFGYPGGSLLGESVEVLLPLPSAERHAAARRRFGARPTARPMGIGLDLAARRLDGSEFPVEIGLCPVSTPRGWMTFATVVDIKPRRAALERLAASEHRMRTVLETSPNAILAIDAQGRITYVNPRVEVAFGYRPEELYGRRVETLLPQRLRSQHTVHRQRYMEDPARGPMYIGMELAGRRKDGTEFPVEISLSPVDGPDGLEVFATVVDITARKAVEAQLLQAQKLESIGRLAGGIAHDFNNILFAINGYAELLAEDLAPGAEERFDASEARRSVIAVAEAAKRGASLTAQLLSFSRQQPVSPRVVDVNEAVAAVEPMLRRLIGERVELTLRSDPSAGRVRVDPGYLDQIMVNLVVNARDAMPHGGSIAIGTSMATFDEPYTAGHFEVAPGTYACLAVTDTGVGMDVETQEHVFEPFFTTKKGYGTGLGMATIYGIVSQAGGHVFLYSEPGLGTTVKVYLPRVDEPVSRPENVAVEPPRETGAALVVEDEPAVRDLIRRFLTRAGYTVLTVEDGAQALLAEAASDTPFDVLITDVIMPGISGIQLAEEMWSRHPGLAIVLLSGYTPEILDLEHAIARGATFVTKPVSATDLLAAVSRARASGGEDRRV